MPLDDFLYGVFLSSKYRYVYIDNPKTGCTSLKSALLELELRGTSTIFELSNYRFIHGWGSPLKQRPPIWPNPTLTDLVAQGFKFVSFVRNPYTRLVSCYLNKFAGNAPLNRSMMSCLPNGKPPENFPAFVHMVTQQQNHKANPHWRLQVANLTFNAIPYTFIGRFESYARDFTLTFAAIGVNETDTPALRHLNQSRRNGLEPGDFYDQELQDMVYRRYLADFETFGYASELWERN